MKNICEVKFNIFCPPRDTPRHWTLQDSSNICRQIVAITRPSYRMLTANAKDLQSKEWQSK